MPEPKVRIQLSFDLREVEMALISSPCNIPSIKGVFKRQTILSPKGGEG